MSVPGGPPQWQQQQAPYPQAPYQQQPPRSAQPADPAKSAAVMLAVAALLALVGAISKSWVTSNMGGEATVAVGPMGVEVCMMGKCVSGMVGGKMDSDVELIMMVALIALFACAAVAGWFAVSIFNGKPQKAPSPKLGRYAFTAALAGGIIFLIRVFAEGGSNSLSPGWAMFPGIGGPALATFALKKLVPFLPAHPVAALPAAQVVGQQPYQQPMQPMQTPGMQPMQTHPFGQPGQFGNSQQPQIQQQQPMQHAPTMPQQPPMQQPAMQQQQPPMQQQQPPMQQPAMQQQQPPQQAAAVPNCPRCGQPLQFVAQYQRWFCAREQQYV